MKKIVFNVLVLFVSYWIAMLFALPIAFISGFIVFNVFGYNCGGAGGMFCGAEYFFVPGGLAVLVFIPFIFKRIKMLLG